MKTLVLVLALAFIGAQAYADILIEPYIGYHMGKDKQGSTSNNDSGATYGGRLGLQKMGLMAGLDYMSGSWTSDTSPTKTTLTPSFLGAFIGYNFPVMLRVYGVYNFSAKTTAKVGSTTAKYDGGDSIKLGVGITSLPFISINLEYMTATYKKLDGATMSKNMTQDLYGLTVSLPLTF